MQSAYTLALTERMIYNSLRNSKMGILQVRERVIQLMQEKLHQYDIFGQKD
jgi:hypothetical protein